MKKILSFVLVLAMVLGSVSMAFATTAVASDVTGLACEEAVNVLTGLGVINGYEDGTFRPERTITRAEAVKVIIAALGLPVTEGNSYSTPFADVSSNAWYAGYVQYAYTLGITEGTSATTFSPNANVTYDQMVTFVVRALGYTEDSLQGTYPACYINKAVGLKMTLPQTGSKAATRGDVARILYSATDKQVGVVNKDGEWVGSWIDTANPETLLSRCGAKSQGKYVLVDKDLLESDKTLCDLSNYYGAVVELYANDDDEVVAVASVLTTFVTGKWDSAKSTFAGYKLATGVTATAVPAKAVAATKTKPAYPTAGGNTIANAAETAVTTFDLTALTSNVTAAVTLTNGKIDAVYSVQSWTVSDAAKLTAKQATAILEDKEIIGHALPKDEDKNIDTSKFILSGVDTLAAIKENDVVYVYLNGSDVEKIEVSNKTLNGYVTKISLKADGVTRDKVYVDGTAYSVSTAANAKPITDYAVSTKDEQEFFFGPDGKLYSFKGTASTESKYAVYLSANSVTDLYGETTYGVNFYTADGKTQLEVKNATVFATLPTTAGDLVTYKLSDGKVSEVKPVAAAYVAASTKIDAKGNVGTLSHRLGANTVVFSFSGAAGEEADAKKYSVVEGTKLYSKTLDKSALVYTEASKTYAAVALVNGVSEETNDLMIVTANANIPDSKYELSVLFNGEKTTLTSEVTGTVNNTAPVVAKATYNEKGEVTALTAQTPALNYTTGNAAKVTDGVLYTDGGNFNLADTVTVYVYDKSDKAWTITTSTTVLTKKFGSEDGQLVSLDLYKTSTSSDKPYDLAVVVRE